MSIVKDKNWGTTKYFHVLAELVRVAPYRGVNPYQNIAVIMGLPLKGAYMGADTTFESVMLSAAKHPGIIFRTDWAFKCGDSSLR